MKTNGNESEIAEIARARAKGPLAVQVDEAEVRDGLYNMAEAMLKMGGGEELMQKTELLMLGIRQSKKLEPRETRIFQDLLVLSYIGPQGDAPELDKKIMNGVSEQFIQSITERVVLEAEKDDRYSEIAKRALLRAVKYGNDVTRKYCAMALGSFEDDAHVRDSLSEISRTDIESVARGADVGLRALQIRENWEFAEADRITIVETEYQDPKMAQRQYVDSIFRAVTDIYNGQATGTAGIINVKTLVTQGISPLVKIDPHSAKLIRRNVESALIHAFTVGDQNVRKEAAEGLKKIGSERIANALDDIVRRERNGNAVLSHLGKKAREVAEAIQKTTYGKVLPPPTVRKQARSEIRLTH